jgi:hypothetical protein
MTIADVQILILLSVLVLPPLAVIFGRWIYRRGERRGRQSAVARHEAELEAHGVDPADGGSLGDLSAVLHFEEQEAQSKEFARRSATWGRWLPWRRFMSWWYARQYGGNAEFWKSQCQTLETTIDRMNEGYTEAMREVRALRRMNAFLNGDESADPKNGKPWYPNTVPKPYRDITTPKPE